MQTVLNAITVRAARPRREGLSSTDESRLRARLRREAPSEPWVDAQFFNVESQDGRGQIIVRRFHNGRVFPPGGALTKMRRCRACGVFTPPGAFEKGVCLDHAEHGSWGESPSAHAIRMLQYRNLKMAQSDLPPESEAALRREIEAYQGKRRRH